MTKNQNENFERLNREKKFWLFVEVISVLFIFLNYWIWKKFNVSGAAIVILFCAILWIYAEIQKVKTEKKLDPKKK